MKGEVSTKTYSSWSFIAILLFIGYNIVGDGTPAALFPILTGQTEKELPESRRGHPDAETVDGFPWIWKQFRGKIISLYLNKFPNSTVLFVWEIPFNNINQSDKFW
jgi:hypothetical protein